MQFRSRSMNGSKSLEHASIYFDDITLIELPASKASFSFVSLLTLCLCKQTPTENLKIHSAQTFKYRSHGKKTQYCSKRLPSIMVTARIR